MKNLLKQIWHWHGWIGKCLTIFCLCLATCAVIGIPLGITKCKQADEIIYTNIFLNEEFELHNNYKVTILSARTVDSIAITNKSGDEETLSGHYVDVELRILQYEESKEKAHKFDCNDFKLKGHTGVYLPLNDIASLVGWDMIDLHWDKAENGFVISAADISTKNAVSDYTFVGKTISSGEEVGFHVFLPISNPSYNVETSVMVLEIDFFTGGFINQKKQGEDIVLLMRPEGLAPTS